MCHSNLAPITPKLNHDSASSDINTLVDLINWLEKPQVLDSPGKSFY